MADHDRGKGFSLRKKGERRHQDLRQLGNGRPDRNQPSSKASSRSRAEPESDSTDSRARPRPRHNDTTSNLVKKRYSIRYNQAPDISQGAPPVPGVPKLPANFAQQDGARDAAPLAHQGVDMRMLRDPSLQSDQYVSSILANATEQDLAKYQHDLKKVKNRASTDLQYNVYQNRTQFIKISKEAEKLKSEIQTLQGLMNELSSTLEQTGWSGRANADEVARRRANRSSVANLEAMWSAQLQTLWKMIEGSQKFVAAIPGRHVVLEMDGWLELDAATWKTKKPAHLVLLNDHLLVATRKRKRTDASYSAQGQKAPTKLVAERCWPLAEIDLVDLTTGAREVKGPFANYTQITGAITIQHGDQAFTYRSERPESQNKDELVIAFKRAAEELRRTQRAENGESPGAATSADYLGSRDPAVARDHGLMRSLSKSKDRSELFVDLEGKQRNLRWVEGQIDELDIDIALQRFDSAVDRVEELRKLARGLTASAVAKDLITVKTDERASQLADVITQLLMNNHAHVGRTQAHIAHLNRLSFSSRARLAYLSARTSLIQTRARACVFEGNVLSHITALSIVYFTLIKNTVDVFGKCFSQSEMSACVVWAKQRLDEYNDALGRALSGVEKGGEVWKEGLRLARELAGGMDEVGLDFKEMVGMGVEDS